MGSVPAVSLCSARVKRKEETNKIDMWGKKRGPGAQGPPRSGSVPALSLRRYVYKGDMQNKTRNWQPGATNIKLECQPLLCALCEGHSSFGVPQQPGQVISNPPVGDD